jgi:hypothetical protein
MKSHITDALTQVAPIILIAISIACSAPKSASAPAQLNSNQTISPSSTPLTASAIQEGTPCTLKPSEAPAINRLKLGMTVEEILALFPGSKEDAELRSVLSRPPGPLRNATFPITPAKYRSAADFKDISRITFTLLDERLSNFTVSYNGPEWPHVDKFVEHFVADKDLPKADQWEPYVGMETQMKTLTCDGFSIRIFHGGEGGNLNYVLVTDVEAEKKLRERRKKAREQASPTPGQ